MVGLFGVLPASVLALVLLRQERRDIAAGTAPPGSKTLIGGLQPVAMLSVAIGVLIAVLLFWPRT